MIFEKIKEFCYKNNISINEFEKRCGIGNGTVGRWKNDTSKPTLSTLEKIERATHIPISIWLGNAEEK